MKKERPILFSTPMVQAILEGRKTQTRRVIKGASPEIIEAIHERNSQYLKEICPYGKPGDRLWVRENYWRHIDTPSDHTGIVPGQNCFYEASLTKSQRALDSFLHAWYKKKPSIFMPKAAARIKLLIEDIRIERIQDITEEDALKEGIETDGIHFKNYFPGGFYNLPPKSSFRSLWDSINEKRGLNWLSNPWVYVIEFKRIPS